MATSWPTSACRSCRTTARSSSHPQGLGNGWANSGGQDLKFVDDMVKLIEDNYCVDTTHVLTNGFSYGGGMSYELACARAKVFRAAAIYEGAQLSGCDGGNDPIALWQMVGLEDTVCPMSLATPIRDRFVKNNGCTAQNPPQPPKAPPYLSPGGHVCTDYAGCSSGHPLRWCVHQSGHGNADRRRDGGPLQFLRDTAQDLLQHLPLYLGPGGRVVVLHVPVVRRVSRAHCSRNCWPSSRKITWPFLLDCRTRTAVVPEAGAVTVAVTVAWPARGMSRCMVP